MEAILKVTPEELMNAAQEFDAVGGTVQNLTNTMLEKMTNMAGVYEGEEAQAFVSKAQGLEDDIAKLVAMIREHATDLQEMAQRYLQSESSNAELIGSLSSDVIV